MKLLIKDRFILLGLLPSKGDYVTLTIKEDIVKKISISQKEIQEIGLTSDGGKISWNTDKEKDNDFKFTELETNMILGILNSLNESKELTDDTFALYKLFNI